VICAIAGLLIKLDTAGPVFFRQYRCGLHGKPFKIWKLRTMSADCCDAAGGAQASRNDPRVTRVGRWLRMTSVDELPQILNILCGEMSWVGPRPHAIEHHEYYARKIPCYTHRLTVKPGLTGLAQVNGHRGETRAIEEMLSRVHYDLDYIRQQSLFLDLWIVLLTLGVLMRPNAY